MELRPSVQYENYSNRPELAHLNQYLNLNSRVTSLVSEWGLIANYSRENSYAAQRPAAVYNEFDPENPVTDATGRITVVSQTYTRVQARPRYHRNLSSKFSMEISGLYQDVDVNFPTVATDATGYTDLERRRCSGLAAANPSGRGRLCSSL
jgi:hypothetical protein